MQLGFGGARRPATREEEEQAVATGQSVPFSD